VSEFPIKHSLSFRVLVLSNDEPRMIAPAIEAIQPIGSGDSLLVHLSIVLNKKDLGHE
jgi:hypothetical protein